VDTSSLLMAEVDAGTEFLMELHVYQSLRATRWLLEPYEECHT
jgi:hypothetical protein